MKKLFRNLSAFAVAVATVAGLSVAAPSAAQAGECTMGWMCGGVSNNTTKWVAYAIGYPDDYAGEIWLGGKVGGNWSGVDVDGFGIPWNCTAGVSGWTYSNTANAPKFSQHIYWTWYKISNNEQVTITSMSCR